jgi:hypothetical protein
MIKKIKKIDIILNLIKNNIKLHNELKDERKKKDQNIIIIVKKMEVI